MVVTGGNCNTGEPQLLTMSHHDHCPNQESHIMDYPPSLSKVSVKTLKFFSYCFVYLSILQAGHKSCFGEAQLEHGRCGRVPALFQDTASQGRGLLPTWRQQSPCARWVPPQHERAKISAEKTYRTLYHFPYLHPAVLVILRKLHQAGLGY